MRDSRAGERLGEGALVGVFRPWAEQRAAAGADFALELRRAADFGLYSTPHAALTIEDVLALHKRDPWRPAKHKCAIVCDATDAKGTQQEAVISDQQ